jgi:putative addiction module killer protein
MIEIRKTDVFAQWLDGLRDISARARIQARIERLSAGSAGDAKPVGGGISGKPPCASHATFRSRR